MTRYDQAQGIFKACHLVGMLNGQTSNGVRDVLLVAALAFDDDGSLPEGDVNQIASIDDDRWLYVAAQLEYGLEQSGLEQRTRIAWDHAIRAACKIAGREYPLDKVEENLIVPF